MQLSDISDAMSLSNAEGWNQTERDWKLLIENPGNICLLAERNKKVIGTTTAMNYLNKVAWIGMVLVEKRYRGLGVSKKLLTTIFKKLESFNSIKLDATPAGQAVYEKFGFKEEYNIDRMINPSVRNLPAEESDIKPEHVELKDINEIIALDELVFGINRGQLIEFLLRRNPGTGWLLKRNKLLTAFAFSRDGNKYHHIGPLVATTTSDAKKLIAIALKNLTEKPVALDVLYDKVDLINWLNTIGFIKQRHFVRMYKNENHFLGVVDRQFLICGPEFG